MYKSNSFLRWYSFSRFPVIPRIVLSIRNWLPFLFTYFGVDRTGRTYFFRNGVTIKTKERIDTATIADAFFRKSYGEINGSSIVIDIGAHIGVFSLYAAATSRDTTTYSYEPMKDHFKMLLENIKNNALDGRIVPYNLGLSGNREKRCLFLSRCGLAHSLYPDEEPSGVMEIDCVSLQDVFDDNGLERCSLLKLNCEGAEYECLYGTPDDYLKRIDEIRLNYHEGRWAKSHEAYNVRSLIRFLQDRDFYVTKYVPCSKDIGDVWLRRTGA